MKRNKIVTGIIITGVALGSFAIGSYTEASTDVLTKVLGEGRKSIGAAGYNKRDELVENVDVAIEAKIEEAVLPLVSEKEQAVQDMLQAYFDTKINEIVYDTSNIEAELDSHIDTIFDRYKEDIDDMFAGY